MRRDDELENRLRAWADDYRGGKYEDIGYPSTSSIATLMTYHGPAPQGLHPRSVLCSETDEVEAAVQALEHRADGYRAGRVLRCEYWMRRDIPEKDRLRALARAGVHMSRATYYAQLRIARVHVAGWLRLTVAA